MFAFNEGLDKAVLKPVAKGYEAAVPLPGRIGVSNFFGNVGDLWIGVNNLLQGKVGDAVSDVGRLLVNSTFGILGFFDVATEFGLEKHDEDFGQTLGRWGVGEGPFLVLPVFGPRTLRDAFGLAADTMTDPIREVKPADSRYSLLGLRLIDIRAQLLTANTLVEGAALDKYSYLRQAYLQRRRSLVHDGNPPRSRDEDDEARLAPENRIVYRDPEEGVGDLRFVSVNTNAGGSTETTALTNSTEN